MEKKEIVYVKVSIESELPPEKTDFVLFDKKGAMYISRRHGQYIDSRFLNELQPISWFSYWLKEQN